MILRTYVIFMLIRSPCGLALLEGAGGLGGGARGTALPAGATAAERFGGRPVWRKLATDNVLAVLLDKLPDGIRPRAFGQGERQLHAIHERRSSVGHPLG